jgi:hypothetical protein
MTKPKKPPSKTKINWMEDAYGKQSCHLNDGGLMAKDSYIGHVVFRDGKWCAVLKGSDELIPCNNLAAAKAYVQDSVGGEPVDIWD